MQRGARHLVGLVAAASFALLSAWWLWNEVPNDEYVVLAEDERLARFSQQCSAEVFLPEDEEIPEGWALQSAVVLLLHGEVSPLHGWPQDPRAPAWDCRPADLPRHWRINSEVHFQAVTEDGKTQLERSFDPELDAGADPEEPWFRSCAADQLTANGFKQAVLNGRRLAGRYSDVLSSAALEAYSIDSKPCLTTAVGSLLPLVPDMEGTVSIRTLPAAADAVVDAAAQLRATDDVLARWCHHGSLPCDAQSCTTPAAAAAAMTLAEKQLCALKDAKIDGGLAVHLKRATERSRLTLLSLDASQLALHLIHLGLTCGASAGDFMRPARGSMLLLERWKHRHIDAQWRVLWNGVDVTQRLPCEATGPLKGCPEAALLQMLEGGAPIKMPPST